MEARDYRLTVFPPNGWQVWDRKGYLQVRPPKNKWCLFMEIIGDRETGDFVSVSYYVGYDTGTDLFVFSDGKQITKEDLFNAGNYDKVIMFNEWACPHVLDVAEMIAR